MLEGIGLLYVIGVVISVVLFILVVRFLWVVPSSLKSLVSCIDDLKGREEFKIEQFDYLLNILVDK